MFLLHYLYNARKKMLYSRTYGNSSAKWRSTSDKSCFQDNISARRTVTKQRLCASADAWFLGLRVRILLKAWIFVCYGFVLCM